ncbi:tetratricopeptide repeat protein [Amycolatopsis rubida]|uniref:Tetratricopeptide repeat-containing protein n=1 Tax=Amycolatopsis rubida TaxID=112413 RepID=A0A1I6BM12_9PSEU|nr:tetratricopeptide repeat protein [Amycolatopsis rubida]SFQ81978.1 Tetratricopeptide repeat-containing protein [Amycolatopsis rubida]
MSIRDASGLALLAGPGGVGKTALAARWIGDQADRFPDGQLYADLGIVGAGGLSAASAEVLNQFLRALGVPAARVPSGLPEMTALFRSVTAEKKLAVLVDNAASAAHVRPLIPASRHCVVVVTSRWRLGVLAMDGGRVLLVDPLDPVSAVELLRAALGGDRVAAEPEPARELAELCGGLPLAMCVAAARLSTRPRWPIARMANALADERTRLPALAVANDAVQASFDLSVAGLEPDPAQAYRLTALHPGPDFGIEEAAAALDRPAAEVQDALDTLVDASLLADAGPDRYRFHDLARLHARLHAEAHESEPARTGAVRRMIAWYLDTVLAADLAISPHRARLAPGYGRVRERPAPGPADALDRLERELPNIVAAMQTAVEQAWWDPVWQFCEGLWGLFLHRKHYSQWDRTHQWGIEAARRCGHARAESRLHVQLGYAHLDTGRYDTARELFASSLDLALAVDDRNAQARAWEHLGLVEQSTGSPQHALEHYSRALAVAEDIEQPRSVALLQRRIGEALRDLDRPDEAATHLEQAAETARETGDDVLRARALTRLGELLPDAARAHAVLAEAADTLGRHGAAGYHAEALEALAEADLAADRVDDADTHLGQALAIYAAAEDPKARRASARLAEIRNAGPDAADRSVQVRKGPVRP